MSSRTWTDPCGRTWQVSRYFTGSPMATPSDWPADKPPANKKTLRIRFTDPADPSVHPSVPYASDKSILELTDEEIAGYWEEVVATHPEFQ